MTVNISDDVECDLMPIQDMAPIWYGLVFERGTDYRRLVDLNPAAEVVHDAVRRLTGKLLYREPVTLSHEQAAVVCADVFRLIVDDDANELWGYPEAIDDASAVMMFLMRGPVTVWPVVTIPRLN